MTAPTFREYVEQYRDEDTRRGDVARTVLADPDWPEDATTPAAVRDRLMQLGLPVGYVTTAAALVASYRRRCRYLHWSQAE